MKLSKFFYACLFWMIASLGHAQDSNELSDLRADTVRRAQSIDEARAELNKYEARIESLESDIAVAEKTLDQANSAALKASIAFSGDPSPANQRVLDRADSSVVLAERKVASLTRRLEFSRSKRATAESQINTNQSAISANKAREDQLLSEINLQEQARLEAEELEAEAQAELAQVEAEAEAIELAEAVAAEPAAEPENDLEVPEVPVESEPAPESIEVESELSQAELVEFQIARQSVAEIEAYLSGDVSKRASIRRPVLRSSKDGRFNFEHLGGEIYLVEAELRAGDHRMAVESSRYRVVVSDADDGEVFKIYLDNRDKDSLKLMTFKKSLLD